MLALDVLAPTVVLILLARGVLRRSEFNRQRRPILDSVSLRGIQVADEIRLGLPAARLGGYSLAIDKAIFKQLRSSTGKEVVVARARSRRRARRASIRVRRELVGREVCARQRRTWATDTR